MKTYEVTVLEQVLYSYIVEAESADEARVYARQLYIADCEANELECLPPLVFAEPIEEEE